MAWTAKLRDAKPSNGKWDVSITYSNGVTEIVRGYVLPVIGDGQIRELARNEVAALDAADMASTTIIKGAFIDLTPPVVADPPAPTADEVAEASWFQRFHRLSDLMRLVELGLLPASDSRIATLQTTLKADFKPAYLDRIRK